MRNGVKFLRFPVSPCLHFTVSPSRRFPVPCPLSFPFAIRCRFPPLLRFPVSPFHRLTSPVVRCPVVLRSSCPLPHVPRPIRFYALRITSHALRPPPRPSHQPSQPSKQQNCSSRFRCRVNSKPAGIPDVCATKHNRHRGVIWAETE